MRVSTIARSTAINHEVSATWKAPTKTISVRLSRELLAMIKELANQLDVPYHSLIKIALAQEVDKATNPEK